MSPSQETDEDGRIGVRVPSNYRTAIDQIQNELDYRAGAHQKVTVTDVVNFALEAYFEKLSKEGTLPEETRDLLDDDLLANAGGDEQKQSA